MSTGIEKPGCGFDPSETVVFDANVVSYGEVVEFLSGMRHIRGFAARTEEETRIAEGILGKKQRSYPLTKAEREDPTLKRPFSVHLMEGDYEDSDVRVPWAKVGIPICGYQALRAPMERTLPQDFYSPSQKIFRKKHALVSLETARKHGLVDDTYRKEKDRWVIPAVRLQTRLHETALILRAQLEKALTE